MEGSNPDLEELIKLWRTREKALRKLKHVDTGAIVYELHKCIEHLEAKRNSVDSG